MAKYSGKVILSSRGGVIGGITILGKKNYVYLSYDLIKTFRMVLFAI